MTPAEFLLYLKESDYPILSARRGIIKIEHVYPMTDEFTLVYFDKEWVTESNRGLPSQTIMDRILRHNPSLVEMMNSPLFKLIK